MTERRPRIAIPQRFSTSASALRHRAEVSSRNLIELVYAAGGEPLMMHPHAPGGVADPDEVAERLSWADGLLLPGGGDIAGRWSGQDEHHLLYDVDLEQDAFDLAAATVAFDRGLAVLAICRGTQLVNVLLGGSLVPDMQERGDGIGNHRNHVHEVRIEPGTGVSRIVGEQIESSCYHHQCIERLADGLKVTARSADDVIEAVERPDYPGWFLGVQWHPEDTWASNPAQLNVARAFIEASRR